jgi:shikimate kinase
MHMPPSRNLILIGLPGSGKSTLGRQLALRLGLPFYDSDNEIEARTGVTIPHIFEVEGEAGFRRREAAMIEELAAQTGIVLATGGGSVLDAQNRRRLREGGFVTYLETPVALLFARTRHDHQRPLLQVEDPLARLKALHAARDPLYRETAHFVLDASCSTPAALVYAIIKEFSRHAQLEPLPA